MISIRILRSIGAKYGQEWITRFGFEAEKHPAYLTMALGAGSVTPADGRCLRRICQRRLSRQSHAGHAGDRHARPPAGAIPPHPLDESMRHRRAQCLCHEQPAAEVTRSGTAARAQATLKRPDLYGKTGTTNDSMDAWFAGYTATTWPWCGWAMTNLASWATAKPAVAWPCRSGSISWASPCATPRLKPVPPEGVVNIGGEWFYEEYTSGTGVRELGPDSDGASGHAPPQPAGRRKERHSGSVRRWQGELILPLKTSKACPTVPRRKPTAAQKLFA